MVEKRRDKEVAAVSVLPREKRLRHFIRVVADFEQVWGIDDGGWVLAGTPESKQVFNVWPFRDYAELYCQGEWAGCSPKAIGLDEFMESYLPDFDEKSILLGVFYTREDNGALLNANELRALLQAEVDEWY